MEKSIIDLFWNSADRRLRAFWRILIQDTVWFALQIGSGLVVGVVLIVALALGGTMSMGDLLGSSDKLLDFLNTPLMNLALQVMVFLITLATVALAGRFLDRRRFAGFGFHFSKLWWLDFGFGLFLGGLLMAAIFAVEFAAGWIRVTGALETTEPGGFFPLMILLPLILFVFVGISEFFRGPELHPLRPEAGAAGGHPPDLGLFRVDARHEPERHPGQRPEPDGGGDFSRPGMHLHRRTRASDRPAHRLEFFPGERVRVPRQRDGSDRGQLPDDPPGRAGFRHRRGVRPGGRMDRCGGDDSGKRPDSAVGPYQPRQDCAGPVTRGIAA
jgi:hypothetical protein